MLVTVITSAINIYCNYYFINGCNMGLWGMGVAGIISNGCLFIAMHVIECFIQQRDDVEALSEAQPVVDFSIFQSILSIIIPLIAGDGIDWLATALQVFVTGLFSM